jgi:hypothetical protein
MLLFVDRDKVQGLALVPSSKQLVSGADDCILGMWDMDVKRIEVRVHLAIQPVLLFF